MNLYSKYNDKELNKYIPTIINSLSALGIELKSNGATYIKIIVLSEIKNESEILNLSEYFRAISKKTGKTVKSIERAIENCLSTAYEYEDNYSEIFNLDYFSSCKTSKNLIESLLMIL